ncbi:hypothetical protein J6590_043158 [Homalodisca vitripennis]|nr:hypothetical protein J6590_043158 [Homalodisca vitripennis]
MQQPPTISVSQPTGKRLCHRGWEEKGENKSRDRKNIKIKQFQKNPASNTILFAPFLTVMVMGDGHICGLLDIIEENVQRGASVREICKPGDRSLNVVPSCSSPDHWYVLMAKTNENAVKLTHRRVNLSPTRAVPVIFCLINNNMTKICNIHRSADLVNLNNIGRQLLIDYPDRKDSTLHCYPSNPSINQVSAHQLFQFLSHLAPPVLLAGQRKAEAFANIKTLQQSL